MKDEPRDERLTVQDNRRGGGGIIAAIVLLFLLGAIGFFFLGGYFEKTPEDTEVNVNVAAPRIDLPDVKIDRAAPATNQSGD